MYSLQRHIHCKNYNGYRNNCK